MNTRNWTGAGRTTSLEAFAAELTGAAYGVALRHEKAGSWIDLELDLWRTLREAVQKWESSMTVGAEIAR